MKSINLPVLPSILKPSIQINNEKYKIIKQIGEGAFGYVYHVKHGKSDLALKKMICQTNEQRQEAKKEIEVMKAIQDDHVLNLIDFSYYKNKKGQEEALLLMPLFHTSLQSLIDHSEGYPYCCLRDGLDVLKIIQHVIQGLQAIHNAGYRHNDLKPGNILLTESYHAVITDFGSAGPLEQVIQSRAEALEVQEVASVHTTASYRAPELFDTPRTTLNGASDIWSLGCLVYCLLYSRTPFETAAEGLSTLSIISGHYQIPESNIWPDEFVTAIRDCLQIAPTGRPTLSNLQQR